MATPEADKVIVNAGDYVIEVTGETLRALKELAAEYNLPLGEMIARALAMQRLVADTTTAGGRVVLEQKDRSRELVPA